ncbi:chemoreceptor glutamine deamidase CheD [Salinisphaera sp. S4-8]|uniref:chemoreceptor glutamine deamidase CheD n=1 Tax=Salinisphaera sp. S4-8 TaxID=633357 RepID=UPI00333E3E55
MSMRDGARSIQNGSTHTYFDQRHGMDAIRVLPNEYAITREDVVLTTVLGSCVAACLRDPVAGVGGLNHFMLPAAGPDVAPSEAQSMRYGDYAMDTLLEALYRQGARRERIEAKVFGGAMLMSGVQAARVGIANSDFILAYLDGCGIDVLSQELKGDCARQVHYFPATGRVQLRRLRGGERRMVAQDVVLANKLAPVLPVAGVLSATTTSTSTGKETTS